MEWVNDELGVSQIKDQTVSTMKGLGDRFKNNKPFDVEKTLRFQSTIVGF